MPNCASNRHGVDHRQRRAGDLFLAAGERYRVPQDGVVLVEALRGMAEVRLVACRRRWIPDLLESCRAMLPKGLATH
jgi:hypothetical protein